MRAVFINPPYLPGFSRGQRSPQVSLGGSMYYPYWLAYAAGLLEDKGFEVKIIDAPARRMPQDAALKEIADFGPALAVLDTSTPSITSDLAFCRRIKEKYPDISLGLVGAHPSVEAENILRRNQEVDWIARREYDYTLLELARALDKNESFNAIAGLSYRQGDNVFHNPDRAFIEDLDALPFAAKVYKKHLKIKDYYFIPALYPMAMVMTGRGCPFRCFFCLWPQVMYGHKCRLRSPESVIDEMLFIKKELPQVKEIVFEDDTFGIDSVRVNRICELIMKNKINIPWFANLRVDVNLETLGLMRRAGLHSCAVGFESGRQEALDFMKKGITPKQSFRFAQEARRLGIIVHGCFMVGFPGETRFTMEETLNFARKLKCDSAQFYPVFLYPGTRAFDWARERGFLKAPAYDEWLDEKGRFRAVYNLDGLSAEEMSLFCRRAYNRFHFSVVFLFRKLAQVITNPMERKRVFFYGFNFLLRLLRCRN